MGVFELVVKSGPEEQNRKCSFNFCYWPNAILHGLQCAALIQTNNLCSLSGLVRLRVAERGNKQQLTPIEVKLQSRILPIYGLMEKLERKVDPVSKF
jgi:hypothetical protein